MIQAGTSPRIDEAFERFMDELGELPAREEEPLAAPLGVFPDGRFYDWVPELGATVETAGDGKRYIVKVQDGKLERIEELVVR